MSASDQAEIVVKDMEVSIAPAPEELAQAIEDVSTDEVAMSDSNERDRDPKNRFAIVFGYVGTRFQGLQRFVPIL